jgi:hypothetical protein
MIEFDKFRTSAASAGGNGRRRFVIAAATSASDSGDAVEILTVNLVSDGPRSAGQERISDCVRPFATTIRLTRRKRSCQPRAVHLVGCADTPR